MSDNLADSLSTFMDAKYVEARGGTLRAPIERIPEEEIGQKKERKRVLFLTGHEKGLPLNKTNLRYIVDKLGADAAQLKGKMIELYLVETTAPTGQPCQGVRVRLPKAAG
jgi:hypothetical protein